MLTGRSGQGKSAVFDALALCLSSRKRSSTYSEYVKQGATHSKIVMNCEINNKPVHFNLQINLVRGTPFQMELTYENKTYKNTEADVLLKSFDIEYYADIIFSMQSDDYRDITQLSPTQRANYLQRLLNFDFVKEKESIKNSINQYIIQQAKINNDINMNHQLISKEREGIETEIPIKTSIAEIRAYEKGIVDKQELIRKSQEKQLELNELNKKLNELTSQQMTAMENENAIKASIAKLKSLKDKIELSEKEFEKANIDIQTKTKELAALVNQEKELEERFLHTETRIYKEDIYHTQLSEYRTQILHIDQLKREKKCPHCGQETEHFADIILEDLYLKCPLKRVDTSVSLKELISIVETELLKSNANQGRENGLKDVLAKDRNEAQLNQKLLSKSITELEKYKVQYKNELDSIDYDPQELGELENKLQLVHDEIEASKTEQDKIRDKLNVQDTVNNIDVLSKEIVDLTNKINKYNVDLKTNKEIVLRNVARNEHIANYEAIIEGLNAQSVEVVTQQNIYEEAFNILDKLLPNYMVVKTCNSLESEMNSFIQTIFPGYAVKLSNSKKGCEFFYTKDISVVEQDKRRNNAWINTKMSSGFEKALLTVSFKISLAQLYGLDMLILDEIDGPADTESSEKLFEQLTSSAFFNQLFLITHKPNICQNIKETFTDCIIYAANQGQFTLVENPD
jgi:DNA repair exonuclease SbcCD ATPase subunit